MEPTATEALVRLLIQKVTLELARVEFEIEQIESLYPAQDGATKLQLVYLEQKKRMASSTRRTEGTMTNEDRQLIKDISDRLAVIEQILSNTPKNNNLHLDTNHPCYSCPNNGKGMCCCSLPYFYEQNRYGSNGAQGIYCQSRQATG